MRRAFSCTRSPARSIAEPPTARLRLPPVPKPIGVIDVSPWRTTTSSNSTPSRSARIWANVVSWPWPCGEVPVKAVTVPLGSTRTIALSYGPNPHIST